MMKYNIGLVKGHYFIDDCTELTSSSLEHYEEITDIKGCKKYLRNITINTISLMIGLLRLFNYLRC